MNIDSFVQRESFLSRCDSRVKILAMVQLFVLIFLPLKTEWQVGLTVALMLLSFSQVGPGRTLGVLKSVAPVLVMMMVLCPLNERGGEALWTWGGFLVLTREGLAQGLGVICRFVVLTYGSSLLVQTTRQADLIQAMLWFKMSYKTSLTVSLILRFIPSMSRAFAQISDSHTLRQQRAGKRGKFSEIVPSLISSLVFALRMIPLTAMSLESRGFGRKNQPSQYHRLPRFAGKVAGLVGFALVMGCFAFLGWK